MVNEVKPMLEYLEHKLNKALAQADSKQEQARVCARARGRGCAKRPRGGGGQANSKMVVKQLQEQMARLVESVDEIKALGLTSMQARPNTVDHREVLATE